MPVFLHPEFIADLQRHNNPHFARRVLQKTINPDGTFREDSDDHPYHGIRDAWIRYVSRGQTAYRVIFLRKGGDTYLFRAGEHSIEDRLIEPNDKAMYSTLPVTEGDRSMTEVFGAISTQGRQQVVQPTVNRFKRNVPCEQINREIFARRNLPHQDIWLVAPFMNGELFAPTARFGRLLLDQVEDGASVILFTAPPKNQNIEWMEKLADCNVNIIIYPRLHTKLYCFVFDENRRYMPGLHQGDRYSSLILVGSANLTSAGMAIGETPCNEELCYAVREDEMGFVIEYVAELIMKGYELPDVRRFKARGQWQNLENPKW